MDIDISVIEDSDLFMCSVDGVTYKGAADVVKALLYDPKPILGKITKAVSSTLKM